jgi:hypothetical protein
VIVRHETERTLGDMEAVCARLGLTREIVPSPATIRKHCEPVAVDEETGKQLFDIDAAVDAMEKVQTRRTHRRKRRS